MADKLKEAVDDVTRYQPHAPRVRSYEVDPGKLYNQKKFDADMAARAGDLEEQKDNYKQNYRKGGMVKVGSPKVTAPCADTKTIKCY